MPEYLHILGSVIPLFLITGVGAFVRRVGLLNEQADRTLVNMLVHVLQPCLILDNVAANPALRIPGNLLLSPLLGFVCVTLGIAISWVTARLYRFPRDEQARTFTFVTGLFNYGYISVPLVTALYPVNTLGVLFVFNLGVEIAFWTVGFATFQRRLGWREWPRIFTTPVRAILLGVAINLFTGCFGLRLDGPTLAAATWGWPVLILTHSIHLIGTIAIPLALLLIGATMADFWGEFRASRGGAVMLLATLVRNGICPLFFLAMAWTLPISTELKQTLVVQAATPAGVFTLLLARHHGGDVPVALQVIFSTSAAAIVTLPLWIHFGMRWVGL